MIPIHDRGEAVFMDQTENDVDHPTALHNGDQRPILQLCRNSNAAERVGPLGGRENFIRYSGDIIFENGT
jgi:hypothetical protein